MTDANMRLSLHETADADGLLPHHLRGGLGAVRDEAAPGRPWR